MFALNQGEVCTCPSRALIQESIYEKFMERALKRVAAIKQGNPLDADTMLGAQASTEQLEKILSYLDIGKQEGAQVLAGGGRAQLAGALEHGYFVQPTVFKGHNKMRIFQEEIFGPVVAVTTFKDADDALSQANDTLYGLGAGVWSRDINTCYRMGRGIKAGRVWTNCYHAYPAHAAFGGYKQSGIGRENHKMMLNHYQQTKNLLVSYSPRSWASSDPVTAAAASRPPPARSAASAADRVRNAQPETSHVRSHAARGRHRRGPQPDRHAAGQAWPVDVPPVRRLLRQLAHVLRAGRIHGGRRRRAAGRPGRLPVLHGRGPVRLLGAHPAHHRRRARPRRRSRWTAPRVGASCCARGCTRTRNGRAWRRWAGSLRIPSTPQTVSPMRPGHDSGAITTLEGGWRGRIDDLALLFPDVAQPVRRRAVEVVAVAGPERIPLVSQLQFENAADDDTPSCPSCRSGLVPVSAPAS